MLMKDNARLAANRRLPRRPEHQGDPAQGRLHPVRTVRRRSLARAAVADQGLSGHPRQGEEDHHLSRRLAGDVRRAGALHALVPASGFRRRPPERLAVALAALLERERPADLHAVLLRAGAGQGRHRHADLPLRRRSSGSTPAACSTWNTASAWSTAASGSKAPARSRIARPTSRTTSDRRRADRRVPRPYRGRRPVRHQRELARRLRLQGDHRQEVSQALASRLARHPDRHRLCRGFFGRSYAEARGYAFQSTERGLQTDQLPIVAPMLDYRFVSEPGVAGAYWGLDTNFMNLRRLDGREVVRIAANPYWTLPYTSSMGDIYRLTFDMPTTIHKAHHVDPDSDDRDPSADVDDFDGTVVAACCPKTTFDWRYPFVRANADLHPGVRADVPAGRRPRHRQHRQDPERGQPRLRARRYQPVLVRPVSRASTARIPAPASPMARNWSAYLPDGSYVNAFLGQSFQFDHDDNDEFRTGDRHRRRPDRYRRPPGSSGPSVASTSAIATGSMCRMRASSATRRAPATAMSILSLPRSYAFIASDGIEFEDREQVSGYAGVNLSDYWSVNAQFVL